MARGRYRTVETCYLSRLGPRFHEAFETCIRRGASEVLVVPYFLHDGLHLLLDIPEEMQRTAALYPRVKVVLGKNLGFDDLLVELVEKRIADSRSFSDVRSLILPPRTRFPVPRGQPVYVPMSSEEASRYNNHDREDHTQGEP